MATEIWLGPVGYEVLLPPVNWIGDPSDYPETYKKNFDSATMLDGKIRYNFQSHSQRSWSLDWAILTKANIDILQALADLRKQLRFKHGMTVNPAWTDVAIKSFSCSVLPNLIDAFKASMTIEEST